MSDELTQAPRIDGEFWVFADGRRLPRLRGAEEPAAVEDTPAAEAAPGQGTPAAEEAVQVDWEKRFKDLQPELTKAQQENARLRAVEEGLRSPDRAADVLRQYGYEFGEDDEVSDQEDEEPDGFRDPRLDTLLQEREQERAQREQEEGWRRFNADLDEVAKGKNISDRDRLLIFTETVQAGGTPEALQKAYGDFTAERDAYDKAVIERYLESKRAPHVSPGGTGATEEVLPLDATHDQRVAYMAQRMGLATEQ